jgi:Family of unknown function (DUF6455)
MGFWNNLRGWRQRMSDLRALDALGPEARQGLARELGIAESTLRALAARGPAASAELERLLKALSVDPKRLADTHPAVMREMAVVCSECDAKSLCRTDLDLHVSAATYDGYCRNTQTIDALRKENIND